MPTMIESPEVVAPVSTDIQPTRFPVRIGFELEFAGPGYDTLLRDAHQAGLDVIGPNEDNSGYRKWQLVRDESVMGSAAAGICDRIPDCCGLELRSPRMTPMSPQMPMLRRLLSLWREKIEITRSSGMHVHISCKLRGATLDANRYAEMLGRRYGAIQWENRLRWANPGYSTVNRYSCVRLVNQRDNHVEVRVFNGTLNNRIIQRRMRYCWRFFRTCLSHEGVNGHGEVVENLAIA